MALVRISSLKRGQKFTFPGLKKVYTYHGMDYDKKHCYHNSKGLKFCVSRNKIVSKN